jgi:hypothetical protein
MHNYVQFHSCLHSCLGNTPPFWNSWRLTPMNSASNICEMRLETRKMFITFNSRINTTSNIIQWIHFRKECCKLVLLLYLKTFILSCILTSRVRTGLYWIINKTCTNIFNSSLFQWAIFISIILLQLIYNTSFFKLVLSPCISPVCLRIVYSPALKQPFNLFRSSWTADLFYRYCCFFTFTFVSFNCLASSVNNS